jgi:hypothetical protein
LDGWLLVDVLGF